MNNESLFHRIVSGITTFFISGKQYSILPNTPEQKYYADILYQDIFYEISHENLLTQNQALQLLYAYGLWSNDMEDRLKNIPKYVEDLKIQMYRCVFDIKKRELLRKNIRSLENQEIKLLERKHALDSITAESYANNLKLQYLIASSVVDEKNNRIWPNIWSQQDINHKPELLMSLIQLLFGERIQHTKIREISRSEPWRSYWHIIKSISQPFPNNAYCWTTEQKTIISYSKMYDNIYNHPDRPTEDIIEDDDLLDGWMALDRKNREIELKKEQAENIMGTKGKNYNEVFVPVNSLEEADKINQLNDLTTRMMKKNREKIIEQQGKIEESQLPDVQMNLRVQANQQFIKKVKGQ